MKRYKPLHESVQRGNLYHFTSYNGLIGILTRNILDVGILGYISFTRDKNFTRIHRHKIAMAGKLDIGAYIQVDGDKLSNNYSIKPYDYYGNFDLSNRDNLPKQTRDKMEERVDKPIKNIKRYITKIVLLKNKFKKNDDVLIRYINHILNIKLETLNFNHYLILLEKCNDNIKIEIK